VITTFGQSVFPNPHDAPAILAQNAVNAAITGFIRGELFFPEHAIANWRFAVFGTPMPEAAVHKDDYSRPPKNEVWFAKYGLVAPPTGDMVPAQQLYQCEFCLLVAASANSGHYIGALRFREDVRHHSS